MKIKILWITYFHFVIIISIFALFLFFNDLFFKLPYELFITVIGSIISFTLIINYERFNKKKIFHEIFEYFNERYDNLNENLHRLKEKKKLIFTYSDDYEFQKRIFIYDYINLCSEEYYWYQEGMINNNVWNNWWNGMKYFLNCKEVAEIIKSERGESYSSKSYYGFLHSELIEKILADNEKH